MKNLLFLLTPCALLLAVLAGCGYHLSGGNRLPSDVETIAVPVFHNDTFEPALENAVTSAVKQEFLTNSRLKVANDPDQADLVLKGTIVSYGLEPLSFDRTQSVVLEYRVHIRAVVTLEVPRTQKVIWKDTKVESSAEYLANPDPAANQVAENRAIAEASQQLAENLVHNVLEGF
ncbi:MAG TPA: LptE family protein [Nitrospiria bacterium]|nr:LptE family protein [Nitrospiria bacterium]